MSNVELRARLERTLQTRISAAEWLDIEEQGYVCDYNNGVFHWSELPGLMRETLSRLRRHVENTQREQRGELLLETDSSEKAPEPDAEQEQIRGTVTSAPLSERTAARAAALNALDQLRLGQDAWGPVVREISSRVRPHVDSEALPQWVIELAIEAWVPAEDVRNIYQHVQQGLLAKEANPQNPPQTFRVAQFVWAEQLRSGKRLSWPELLERWKERNPYERERFKSWRAFRTCCERGQKATPPRYAQSNDYIASEARDHMASEARRLRQRLRFLPQ